MYLETPETLIINIKNPIWRFNVCFKGTHTRLNLLATQVPKVGIHHPKGLECVQTVH